MAQLPGPENLWATVVHPDIEILTKVAREILPLEVPLDNVTQQVGNLGGLLCGLIQDDYELISRSIHDVIAEPRRQKLIPEFYRAKRDAMAAGALGFSISGAGPSVFALAFFSLPSSRKMCGRLGQTGPNPFGPVFSRTSMGQLYCARDV